MDGQGENTMPNGVGGQTPFNAVPQNSPDSNAQLNTTPDNNIQFGVDSTTPNVAQHVLDDISGSQPVTTSEPLTEPFTAPSPEPWVTPGSTPISSADVPNPELTPESVPGETARIHAALSHPYFSNHPTQTSASGVGDIVIDNRPAKKARRLNLSRGKVVGAVVAVVVAVVIIVVAVSAIIPTVSRPNRAAVLKSYGEFSEFLKTGSSDSNSGGEWFVDSLTDDSLNIDQTNDATNQIYKLYDNFVTKFNDSDLASGSNLSQDILNEKVLLILIGSYANSKNVVDDLTKEILDNNGQTNIEDLVNRILPAQTYSDKQALFRETLSKYLMTKLQMVEFYNNSYCYYDDMLLDGDCVALLDIDEAYAHLATVNELAALYLKQDKAGMLEELHSQTNKLQEALK